MEIDDAVRRLSALAQESRLAVFRRLMRAGPDGLAAGDIARELGITPNTLSAQLNVLANAGLVKSRRDGRFVVYSACFDAMSDLLVHLVEDCCEGNEAICGQLADATERIARCA